MTPKKVLGLVLIVAIWLSFVRFVTKRMEAQSKYKLATQSRAWQIEAVRVGHDRWTSDLEGNTVFQWLATKTSEVK